MLDLNFNKKFDAQSVIDCVSAARATKGNRAANKELLDAIGLTLNPARNEAYYGEALNYHLALVFARLGDTSAVGTHMQQSNTMPAGGGDTLFTEHVLESVKLRERQDRARARGTPSVLITSMPRSASSTLATIMSHQFDIPILRVSVGDFPNYIVAPSWLGMFLGGGAVTYDHFGATSFNLKALAEHGVRDLFVLIRDPRASAASAVRFRIKNSDLYEGFSFEKEVVAALHKSFLPWLHGWINCAAETCKDIHIHWIFWEDLRNRPNYVVDRIRQIMGNINSTAVMPSPDVKQNFVTGDDSSWRTGLSRAVQRDMWESLAPSITDLLNLQR